MRHLLALDVAPASSWCSLAAHTAPRRRVVGTPAGSAPYSAAAADFLKQMALSRTAAYSGVSPRDRARSVTVSSTNAVVDANGNVSARRTQEVSARLRMIGG